MEAKLVAGACLVALAAMSGPALSRRMASCGSDVEHAIVLRMSVPLPFGGARGYTSFSSSLGQSRWTFAATWSGGTEHRRLAVVLASNPANGSEDGPPKGRCAALERS
jgi:hypothetical protein